MYNFLYTFIFHRELPVARGDMRALRVTGRAIRNCMAGVKVQTVLPRTADSVDTAGGYFTLVISPEAAYRNNPIERWKSVVFQIYGADSSG